MRKLVVIGAVVVLAAFVSLERKASAERVAPAQKSEKARVSAGNGTLIIGSYPKQYLDYR